MPATSASSGAAAETIEVTADRSCPATAGCLAKTTTTGGATKTLVIRSRSSTARNCSRSNRGSTTTVAPACSGRFISAVMP